MTCARSRSAEEQVVLESDGVLVEGDELAISKHCGNHQLAEKHGQ